MKTYKSIFRCAAAALVVCCTACTDEWNNHYDDASGVGGSATLTLWEQIQARPELKNFAEVCDSATFRTSETGKVAPGFRISNLLGKPDADGNVANFTVTVFAPIISDEQCDSLLALLAEGKDWDVQSQFISTYIRRNRLEVKPGEVTKQYMLNAKLYSINGVDNTFGGVKIDENNIAATNGVLHVLDGTVTFTPNLHEYLRIMARENFFAQFIVDGDSSYFVPSLSIEGEPDQDGLIHYLDSVFITTNAYFGTSYRLVSNEYSGFSFKALGVDVSAEDSSYVMIVPSNKAFLNAYEKYSRYFRYAAYYEDNATRNNITKRSDVGSSAVVRTMPNVENYNQIQDYLDILQRHRALGEIMSLLVYNIHTQYNPPAGDQIAMIDAFDEWRRSDNVRDTIGFLTVSGDTLRSLPYHPYYRVTQVDSLKKPLGINWDVLGSWWSDYANYNPKTQLFGDAQPVRMSNGLAYMVDKLDVNPMLNLHKDIKIECEGGYIYQPNVEGADYADWVPGNVPVDSITSLHGKVSGGYFVISSVNRKDKRSVTFRLDANILSAPYDIYVVTVPASYHFGKTDPVKFKATLNYRGDEDIDDTNKGNYSTLTSDVFSVNNENVETVLLFENFEFPYCYASLPNSYPTLTFTTEEGGRNKSTILCLDFIYLKAKE